jgi:hypothetical protein
MADSAAEIRRAQRHPKSARGVSTPRRYDFQRATGNDIRGAAPNRVCASRTWFEPDPLIDRNRLTIGHTTSIRVAPHSRAIRFASSTSRRSTPAGIRSGSTNNPSSSQASPQRSSKTTKPTTTPFCSATRTSPRPDLLNRQLDRVRMSRSGSCTEDRSWSPSSASRSATRAAESSWRHPPPPRHLIPAEPATTAPTTRAAGLHCHGASRPLWPVWAIAGGVQAAGDRAGGR